ncbi:MAG TPA: exo-alpha-sialidase [Chryseosolibacter sp.]|nr:exo-alpha-sialidase [Chryseosolibacter sp.]
MSRLNVRIAMMLLLLHLPLCTLNAQAKQGVQISAEYIVAPLFKGVSENAAVQIRIFSPENNAITFTRLNIRLDPRAIDAIERVAVHQSKRYERGFDRSMLIGSAKPSQDLSIAIDLKVEQGLTYAWVSVALKHNADIDSKLNLRVTSLNTDTGGLHLVDQDEEDGFAFRTGIALRKAWDDSAHTYRIPGLITTDKGTLIAVYDIRHKSSRDLPGNVDVGMSRSTDGGETWEPMKTIMDMGPPHENNGIGDPCILFDPATRTIWVAALWSKGNRSIAGSEPGLSPDSTGQFVLVSSKDDGLTWSQPYNITSQVKDPKWHLYFQGPGSGIAMADGTLVFPSQFWDESKKPGMPHSSIIYSTDYGKTWRSGNGAKPNTTESQVVETTPGVLMLNMRDNRGKFRSIFTTKDFGETWLEHHTSQEALPDPVCMASIVKANVKTSAGMKEILFFSNVATSTARKNTTIKASLDLGESWPEQNQLLLDERRTYGYSSLARIDENTIGLLYEGERDLYFVRVPVNEIIK